MIAKPGVQEKVLLHLLDYADFKEKVEVPFSLSQMGIANAVAIARSNVPRAISGLRDQGLLVERQAHTCKVLVGSGKPTSLLIRVLLQLKKHGLDFVNSNSGASTSMAKAFRLLSVRPMRCYRLQCGRSISSDIWMTTLFSMHDRSLRILSNEICQNKSKSNW